MAATAFAVYATYSLTRFRTGHAAGYDLGIFTQVVSRYAHLQAPDIGINLGWDALGDHFSPALALLAPFYRLVPRPETLLVAQAALTAVSVVPPSGQRCRPESPGTTSRADRTRPRPQRGPAPPEVIGAAQVSSAASIRCASSLCTVSRRRS